MAENKTEILSSLRKRSSLKVKNYVEPVKRKLFKCRACGSSFKSKQLLYKHVETHIGTPISCRSCKKGFNSRLAYTCHVKLKLCQAKLEPQRFQCDQCPKVFRFKRHIEKHLEGHKRNNCTYCEVKLTTRSDLVEHLQSIHSIKLERAVLHKCDYCEKRYIKKRSLYCHLKQHAENKIVCMECGFMSINSEEHNKHFLQHDKDRPWKCEKCNDKFSRKQQYLYHLKRHEKYKCLTCEVSHASRAVILRHKQRGHSVKGLDPHFKCPHCPNAFYRRYALQIHLRKHNEDRPMHCKYCNMSFRSPYLYFKHCASTTHEIKSPAKIQLVCEICGKIFIKKYQLELHLKKIHNQNKPSFACTYCSHKTSSSKNMERHVALHLENKKECICEQCGKTFYNLNTLKDHVSYVHVQQKQFKCQQCEKTFKRNSELVRHEATHSDNRPHACKICGHAYKRLTHLKRHEKSQHGVNPSSRRVQRLKQDQEGNFIPISEEKQNSSKTNKKKQKSDEKQIFSVVDTHILSFGVEFSGNSQNLVTIPCDLSSRSQNANVIDEIGSNINNQVLNSIPVSQSQNYSNILQEAIENSTTCDILLPENNDGQKNDNYLRNPYDYL